ncbi:hypothetical protein SDC9_138508 [bioreactor metagenome]|uniref:Uncharacterized protein n=1 Tax=bioreactor metagenome TaxID=1076179 RepID=A0A645DPG3_9ZZZZ
MTVGMIIDYLITAQNEETEAKRNKKPDETRYATAADVNAF